MKLSSHRATPQSISVTYSELEVCCPKYHLYTTCSLIFVPITITSLPL